MKKAVIFFLALSAAGSIYAQKNFEGTWQGTLNAGISLRIVFHITSHENVYSSTMDSPDQSVSGIACDSTTADDADIRIVLSKAGVVYTGSISGKEKIKGTFFQRGMSFSLELKKLGTDSVQPLNRPQTPKGPFPYKSMDVEYDNADRSLHYGATITIPEGSGPHPAILLITGSGAQDRDETILGHKSFAVIADHLTRKGYIVMRVDDRGIGKSTGVFSKSTSEDFAKDVNTSIDYLKTVNGVDKNKIGLIGHSEGGMIAPVVAAERNDINFIVLLAGPGVKITELMTEQNAAMYASAGVNENAVSALKPLYKEIAGRIMAAPDTATAYRNAYNYFTEWAMKEATKTLRQLDFDSDEKRSKYIHTMVGQLSSPWFKYFMAFDPAPYLEKLHCKVLALNGSRDIQVIASQNLPGIETALKKAGVKDYEIKELPGLNHLFQTCKECTVAEYAKLEETFSPAALDVITEWLNKHVK